MGWDGFKTWPEEENEGGKEAEVPPPHPVTPPLRTKTQEQEM